MSNFSKYLELSIINSGMTEKQLAKISGFTRSYIALMKNGQRVSPDVEKMTKLLQVLNLSPDEYDSLWAEYIRARIGNDVYERTVAVLDFIHSFNSVSNAVIRARCYHELLELQRIDNRLDMEYLIRAVIENESMKENGYVHIIMQGSDNVLPRILPAICRKNKKLRVDHIVCMEKYAVSSMDNNQLYNVKMLKEIIPIVVFSNSLNYKVHYYYDHVASRFNSGMLLPYMILTSECLLSINADMKNGILTKEQKTHQLYEEMFQNHKKHCREMFEYTEGLEEVMTYFAQKEDKEKITYSLAAQPCFGVLRVVGLIRKYCKITDENIISRLEENLKKNEHWISNEDNIHISYCCKSGLERFAREGIVDELPREIYTPLSVRDRKRILQMLLERIDDSSYELYLLDENTIQLPKELIITVYGISNVLLLYLSEYDNSRIVLREGSMMRLLYEAFQNLMKNPLVSTKEEAKIYVSELIMSLGEEPQNN